MQTQLHLGKTGLERLLGSEHERARRPWVEFEKGSDIGVDSRPEFASLEQPFQSAIKHRYGDLLVTGFLSGSSALDCLLQRLDLLGSLASLQYGLEVAVLVQMRQDV